MITFDILSVYVFTDIVLITLFVVLYNQIVNMAWDNTFDFEFKRFNIKFLTFVLLVIAVGVLATSLFIFQELKLLISKQY